MPEVEQGELPHVVVPQPINLTAPQGPLVSVLHSERKMMIYGVTENELRTLSVMNVAMAAFFSLGTGCFGYLLNLQMAMVFAEKISTETHAVIAVARPGLIGLGVTFYVLGIVAWLFRGGFINTIKRESTRRQSVVSSDPVFKSRWSRAWATLRGDT